MDAGILNKYDCMNSHSGLQSGAYCKLSTYVICMHMHTACTMFSAAYSAPPKITNAALSDSSVPTATICGWRDVSPNFSLSDFSRCSIFTSISPGVYIKRKENNKVIKHYL